MSVVQSKRGESEAQFIETARKLEVFTLQTVTHFPKRYTFYLSQPIFQISQSIHGHVKHANSICPKTKHEAQTRRDEFIMAKAELYDMISQVGIARDTYFGIANMSAEEIERKIKGNGKGE